MDLRRTAGPVTVLLFSIAIFSTGLIVGTYRQPNQQQQAARGHGPEGSSSPRAAPESSDDRIADYTWWLGAFTGALVVVSAVQMYFLIRADNTARETADAANRSARVAESSLRDIQRAFVYFTGEQITQPELPLGPESKFVFNFTWKNSGTTGSVGGVNHGSWVTMATEMPADWNFPNLGDCPGRSFVGPGGSTNLGPFEIPAAAVVSALEGLTHLYFYGWFEYDDVFERTPRHRSEFCIKLAPIHRLRATQEGYKRAAIAFLFQSRHNGADEDCTKPIETGSKKNPLPEG